MNTQPIEKRITTDSGFLSVHSIFYTIQGEGPFCGTPAIFVRLAGCNLQCPSCDTLYTEGRTAMTVSQVHEAMLAVGPSRGLVVITGGEPFRQKIGRLINYLTDCGYYVQVETNGTLPPEHDVNWNLLPDQRTGAYIVCSPKTGKMITTLEAVACAFKYVIEAGNVREEDGLPITALKHSAHPHVARPPALNGRPVYVQPLDSGFDIRNKLNLQQAIKSCMKFGYVLQLQVHKIIEME